MLDKQAKDIDAVIITTPDHMHAVQALALYAIGQTCICGETIDT